MELKKQVDVCVVGAGHAGCEAALACARLGLKTVIFTVSVDSIALMPCNPNVGGSSKGHLVRELDPGPWPSGGRSAGGYAGYGPPSASPGWNPPPRPPPAAYAPSPARRRR